MRSVKMLWVMACAVAVSGCESEAEKAVRETLVDPSSAEFKDVETCPGDSSITTGQVNGKNRMGAYAGFNGFFVEDGRVVYAGDDAFMQLLDRCYDTGGSRLEDAAAEARAEDLGETSPANGDWVNTTDTNPIDDTKTEVASLIAESGSSSRGNSITLVARCESNQTEMYVNWNDYLGDDSNDVYSDWKYVTVRVGKDEAQKQRWSISTDNEATFAPGSPISLLKDMARTDKLVLQTTPYNESPVTAIFNLNGIKSALKPVADGCGWSID